MDRKVRGYTVLETLVVIAIVAILAGFVLLPMLVHVARERLRASTTQLTSDMNQARLKSISTGSLWGIRVCRDSRQYKVFIDSNADCRDVGGDCRTADATRICMNDPLIGCAGDWQCPGNSGPCVERERLVSLPMGVSPVEDFLVVFDRRGYALNASCGIGAGSITLRNAFNEERRIIVDRLGRISYE